MASENISAGLKNAVERGFSLEAAVKSFINAGYSPAEVNEAASLVHGRVISNIPTTQSPQSIQTQQTQVKEPVFQSLPSASPIPEKKKGKLTVIILIVVLIILLIVLGFTIFAGDTMNTILQGLTG